NQVEMIDMLPGPCRMGQLEGQASKQLPVVLCGRLTPRFPIVEIGQLHAKDRRLDRVEASIAAHNFMLVLRRLAEVAQQPYSVRDVRTVGNHHPTIAECTEVLCRIEAESRAVGDSASPVRSRRSRRAPGR